MDEPGLADLCSRVPNRIVDLILLRVSVDQVESAQSTPGFRSWRRASSRSFLNLRRRQLAATTGLVALAFVVLPRVLLDGRVEIAFVDLIPALAAFAGGSLCLRAWRAARPDSPPDEARSTARGWLFLGAAALAWGCGEMAWTMLEVVLGNEVPLPSLADVGYLTALPLMTAALLLFPNVSRYTVGKLRLLVDGGIAAVSLSGIVSLVALHAAMHPDDRMSWIGGILAVTYALGDTINLSIASTFLVHTRGNHRAVFGFITAGLASIWIADVGFLYKTFGVNYHSGDLIDLGWIVGFLLLGHAALTRAHPLSFVRTSRPAAFVRLALPHIVVLAFLTATAMYVLRDGALPPWAWSLVVLVMILSVCRYIVIGLENYYFGEDLARRVEELQRDSVALHESADAVLRVIDSTLGGEAAERVADALALNSAVFVARAQDLRNRAQQFQERQGRGIRR